MSQSAIVVFSSHVVRGTVGLRAAALALEALGHSVWSVPTTVLSHHPGHGIPHKVAQDAESFTQMVESLQHSKWTGEVDAVICGYFASVQQVIAAANFHAALQKRHPEKPIKLVIDPVIGDNGRLYVDQTIAEAIRDQLVAKADLITPNCFELAWLSGQAELANNNEIISAARQLMSSTKSTGEPERQRAALVTSAFPMMSSGTGSLYYSQNKAMLAEHRHFDNAPNGLGDLTSALITHHLLSGMKPAAALEKTAASTVEILKRTIQNGGDELAIEANIGSLLRPLTSVQMRQLLVPKAK